MLSGQVLRRNVKHILSTNANFHTASIENIEAFQNPSITETLLPSQLETSYDLQPYKFGKVKITNTVNESTNDSKDILRDKELIDTLLFHELTKWPGRESDTSQLCNVKPEFDD